MISIKNLSFYYPVKKHPPRQALFELNLGVTKGALFTLTGPNGGGKSTLFRLLCGLSTPSQGEIHLDGLDIQKNIMAARRLTGVVFQHPALDKHLTVQENFQIHADLYAIEQRLFKQRLEEDLLWTGLKNRLGEKVGTLSGGMARRVELVKAVLHRPKILLMDEPTNGLDPGGRRDFLQMINRLRREREMTVLMNSHLFDEAERADQVAILHQGRLLAVGSPTELRERLGHEMIVIQTSDQAQAEDLSNRLINDGLTVRRRELELRIEGIDSQTVSNLLLHYRERFQVLFVKQPTLEDLFIHITGQDEANPS
ncbi:MAG: ABC transporter ATP-binding protein [Magnetococcales bacterium]|nr:ABC transporter ATP-binding protein [Magnetococcales bacterium]